MTVSARVAAGALLAATLFLDAPIADAHATLDRSSPSDGATVDQAPVEVWADFTEPPAPSSTLRITDHCGRVSDDGNVRIELTRMTVGMRGTAPSRYTVTWRTVSLVDGHPAKGAWTFTVAGSRAPCSTEAATPTTTAASPAAGSPAPATGEGREAASSERAVSAGTTTAPTDVDHSEHGGTEAVDQPTDRLPTVAAGVALPDPVDRGSSSWLRVALPLALAAGIAPWLVRRVRRTT